MVSFSDSDSAHAPIIGVSRNYVMVLKCELELMLRNLVIGTC